MKTKSGRFNYLPSKEESPEAKQNIERFEYKQIMNKLSREHLPKDAKDIFAFENSPKRSYSPIGQVLQLKNNASNREIKSIILNDQIFPNRHQQAKIKQDAYRIIKDAHIAKDQDFNNFYQEKNSPPKVYYSPLKDHKQPYEDHQKTIIKFYRVVNNPQPKDQRKINNTKNNKPYIYQPIQVSASPGQNPQNKPDLSESRTTRTNKAYKAGKSQQRIYQNEQSVNPLIKKVDKNKNWKRSCYDYVPEEMKVMLNKQVEW